MLKSFPLKIMSVLPIMGKTFYFIIYKLIFIALHNSNSAKLKIFFHYSHFPWNILKPALCKILFFKYIHIYVCVYICVYIYIYFFFFCLAVCGILVP